jgi:hypothetical protein
VLRPRRQTSRLRVVHCVLRTTVVHCVLRTTVVHCVLRTTVVHCVLRTTVVHCVLRTTVGYCRAPHEGGFRRAAGADPGGYALVPLPKAVTRVGTWVLVGVLGLGALMIFVSSGPWERFG